MPEVSGTFKHLKEDPQGGSQQLLSPVRVVGMQWSAAVIVGMQGLPHLALSRWWSTKGVFATKLREAQEEAFRVCFRKWGPLVVHLFDRG